MGYGKEKNDKMLLKGEEFFLIEKMPAINIDGRKITNLQIPIYK